MVMGTYKILEDAIREIRVLGKVENALPAWLTQSVDPNPSTTVLGTPAFTE